MKLNIINLFLSSMIRFFTNYYSTLQTELEKTPTLCLTCRDFKDDSTLTRARSIVQHIFYMYGLSLMGIKSYFNQTKY